MARRVIALLYAPPVIDEQEPALEAFTPGHLLKLTPTGLIKNTDAAANVAAIFALERDELGKDIDQPYAVGDFAKTGAFWPGQRVYAFLASGQNVAKGDYLTGTATGLLTASGVSATVRTALALEAVNSVSDTTRIRVEIV